MKISEVSKIISNTHYVLQANMMGRCSRFRVFDIRCTSYISDACGVADVVKASNYGGVFKSGNLNELVDKLRIVLEKVAE